eukprot:GHVR01186248.1.p1 GENE.GHVR01186248.1~~GHVR01186248.1.p1  ORF type:complete len:100 (-),score=1.96 GHVR01186248.1:96-395(-)
MQINDRIKQKVKLSVLAMSYGVGKFKHVRKNQYLACCPFHHDKNSSLSINDDKGVFNCFGCGVKGDIFTFIMKLESISFKEAISKLSAITSLSNNYKRG